MSRKGMLVNRRLSNEVYKYVLELCVDGRIVDEESYSDFNHGEIPNNVKSYAEAKKTLLERNKDVDVVLEIECGFLRDLSCTDAYEICRVINEIVEMSERAWSFRVTGD